MPAYVISEREIEGVREEGDTAETRVAIDEGRTGHLKQSIVRFGSGRARSRSAPDGTEEVLYVVSGSGVIHLNGDSHEVAAETGVYIAPGEQYDVENTGESDLIIVSVLAPLPDEPATDVGERRVTVRLADQSEHPAGKDRKFWFVVNPDVGCKGFTQFVGWIPPGRAKDHYHLYNEVVYILEGDGVLHREGEPDVPISQGSCIHFPPRMVHCLENVGGDPIRVLGVFYPPGSAAEAYNPDES